MNATTEASSEALQTPSGAKSLEGHVVGGSYRIGARLGSGGMGEVYEAEHLRLGSKVAVKFMRATVLESARAVQRFRQEARRVAVVQSEHIVRVFDCGEVDDGVPYLVMERLQGEDLRALLDREGPLPVRRAVELVRDACRGLSVVHGAGLVHRDLKPANLFIVGTDGAETCKILDFGVVKELASESTHQGVLLGTVRYMAPEQLEDASSATASADVYALGAILYECLTGVAVQSGGTLQEIMFAILHRDPKPPSEFRALPAELDGIVLAALARDVAKRFSSAEALDEALAPFGRVERAPSPVEATDEDTWSGRERRLEVPAIRAVRTARRGASWVVGGALLTGVIVGWLARGSDTPARAGAREELRRPPSPVIPTTRASPAEVSAAPLAAKAAEAVAPVASSPSARPAAASRGDAARSPSKRNTAEAPLKNRVKIADRFDPSDPYE